MQTYTPNVGQGGGWGKGVANCKLQLQILLPLLVALDVFFFREKRMTRPHATYNVISRQYSNQLYQNVSQG